MLAVVERFGAERVCLALASEARRKRRRPIKSWRLWAEIVGKSLAEEPRAPPPAPGEMAALLNGESVPRAALMAAIERWNAGGDWPTSLGGPPRRHGCALPETFLAMCVEGETAPRHCEKRSGARGRPSQDRPTPGVAQSPESSAPLAITVGGAIAPTPNERLFHMSTHARKTSRLIGRYSSVGGLSGLDLPREGKRAGGKIEIAHGHEVDPHFGGEAEADGKNEARIARRRRSARRDQRPDRRARI